MTRGMSADQLEAPDERSSAHRGGLVAARAIELRRIDGWKKIAAVLSRPKLVAA